MTGPSTAASADLSARPTYDAVVIGAGFAGLYMLHRLRQLGLRAHVFEAGDDIGGTWYWNRYPGARCDVESVDYAYTFSPELQQAWTWTERFATQAEILRYIHFVAERLDLRRDISLRTRVEAAEYDESADLWHLRTARGERVSARFCIMAVGCLSHPVQPDIPGLPDFAGRTLYTASWPEEGVDLRGQRVGVVGTGSSGIQLIPAIAAEVGHLFVFQRTPSFSVPAQNAPLDPAYVRDLKAHYGDRCARNRASAAGYVYDPNPQSALEVAPDQRAREFEARWQKGGAGFLVAYRDLLLSEAANDTAAEFVRGKIREIVTDPEVAAALQPRGFPIGARRLCLDTDYYATFNRPNVTLVDLQQDSIATITPHGVHTARAFYALDTLVFATGFDAMTGSLLAIDVRGRGGLSLRQKWADGPQTYLGVSVAGFPNMLIIAGPGSPSVLSNMILAIEQHVDWIAECIGYLEARTLSTIEATPESEHAWGEQLNAVAERTLYPRTRSWYTGANVAGKPRVFMPYVGGLHRYREICAQVADDAYRGFALAGGLRT